MKEIKAVRLAQSGRDALEHECWNELHIFTYVLIIRSFYSQPGSGGSQIIIFTFSIKISPKSAEILHDLLLA